MKKVQDQWPPTSGSSLHDLLRNYLTNTGGYPCTAGMPFFPLSTIW